MLRARRRYIFLAAILLAIVLMHSREYLWRKLSRHSYKPLYLARMRTAANPHDITIVTMFVNIGQFMKYKTNFSPATYKNWMTTWGWLTNKVVAFFDNDEDLELFRQIRSVLPADRTVLIKLQKTEIPAFNKLEKIRTIYKNPLYPTYSPNTVVAEYSCAMNAKYDILQMAVQRGLVHTEYMAWLDIGFFRNLLEWRHHPADDLFALEVPENFNSSTVGVAQITPRTEMSKFSPWDYIKDNHVWVGGGFILATKEVMMKFAQSYTLMANELIDKGMSSTDQQVIGAMYSPDYIKLQPVDIAEYSCYNGQFGLYGSDLTYFCLGYKCKDAVEKRLDGEQRADQVSGL